jgi:hypothetical protein
MNAELPTPLTPADCNLRDFSFMPLDVSRLRDSDLAGLSTGNEFRSAVLLWCASWHQVPAASLPDDDISLAKLAGFGFVVKEWKKVREGALRGWIKCSDGRLYHPVVSEKANEAWQGRLDYRDKKEADRLRKAAIRAAHKAAEDVQMNKGNPQDNASLSAGQNQNVQRTNGGNPPENTLIGTVDSGQGQWTVDSGQLTSKPKSSSDTPISPAPAQAGDCDDAKSISRNVQVSILLRAGQVKPMTAMHPLAIEWADNPKITDALLRDAIDQARQYKPDGDIHPNYLRPIITEKLNPAPPRTDNDWRKSNPGIDAKGRELGMFPKGQEGYPQFADRIAEEIRKRKSDPSQGGKAA